MAFRDVAVSSVVAAIVAAGTTFALHRTVLSREAVEVPSVLGLPRVPMHLVVAGELELLGSHGMAARSYPGMLGLVAAGRLDPGALVRRRIGLEAAGEELLAMGRPAGPGADGPRGGVTVAIP